MFDERTHAHSHAHFRPIHTFFKVRPYAAERKTRTMLCLKYLPNANRANGVNCKKLSSDVNFAIGCKTHNLKFAYDGLINLINNYSLTKLSYDTHNSSSSAITI